MGTPPYMAPEQWRQEPLTPATDVWGLGATLYELLTLRRAFPAHTRDKLQAAILEQEPAAPRSLVTHLPIDLDAICRMALRKEPEDRYDSAKEFAEELRRWLRGEPARASRSGPVRRAWLWGKRNRGWAAAGMLAFVSLLLLSVATWALGVMQERRTDHSSVAPLGVSFDAEDSEGDSISRVFGSRSSSTANFGIDSAGVVTRFTFDARETDLVATSLAWNPEQGGVEFGYEVQGADLTEDVVAALYWSADEQFDAGDTLAYDTTIERPQSSYGPFYVPMSGLLPAPASVRRLLLVTDPGAVVAESSESNNLRSLLPYALKDSSVVVPTSIRGGLETIASRYLHEAKSFLVITDGLRTAADQALRMYETLEGPNGLRQLRRDYRKHPVEREEIVAAYLSHNNKPEQLAEMTRVIQEQMNQNPPFYISRHLVGKGVDIRTRDMSGRQLVALRRAIRLVPGAGLHFEADHMHLELP